MTESHAAGQCAPVVDDLQRIVELLKVQHVVVPAEHNRTVSARRHRAHFKTKQGHSQDTTRCEEVGAAGGCYSRDIRRTHWSWKEVWMTDTGSVLAPLSTTPRSSGLAMTSMSTRTPSRVSSADGWQLAK